MVGMEDKEVKKWELLKTVALEKAQNVAFELTDIDCEEMYIFANVGITEPGNVSIDINEETRTFVTYLTSNELKYFTIHAFMVGNRFMLETIESYALTGYTNSHVYTGHPQTGITDTRIKHAKLFRNAPASTFLEGSAFEIWGR